MKTFLLLALTFTLHLHATEYYVLEVKGDIYLNDETSPLERGDYIASEDDVRFATRESKAALLSNKKLYSLKANKAQKAENAWISQVVKAVFPPEAIVSIDAKGDDYLEQLGIELAASIDRNQPQRVLVIDTWKLEIDTAKLPIDEQHFLVLWYEYRGETIRKKLNTAGSRLVIDREIFNVDGAPIAPVEVRMDSLFYYDLEKSKKLFVARVDFVVITKHAIKEQLRSLLSIRSEYNSDNEFIEEIILPYLNEFYGYPAYLDHDILTDLIEAG